MMTVSFSIWELAVLIIAIAFVFGTVYLIKVFKNLGATLETTAKLMDENRAQIHNIMDNVDSITQNADDMTHKANDMLGGVEDSVNHLKSDVVDPLVGAFAKIAKVMQVISKGEARAANKKEKKIKKV